MTVRMLGARIAGYAGHELDLSLLSATDDLSTFPDT